MPGFCPPLKATNCGSEPARDEVGTSNISASRTGAIASKLAPTGVVVSIKSRA
jgi:hypothetical protein